MPSVSGLFVLPGEEQLGSAAPAPEPAPELSCSAGTVLDHGGVRIGREVLLSREELQRVGRSKALCQGTRNFIAQWTDGAAASWFNTESHTGSRELQAWPMLTQAARAEKLAGLQKTLGRGRAALEAVAAGEAALGEADVAALCLALVAASVDKNQGFVVGTFVVEDPGQQVRLHSVFCSASGV
jgi:hypothetical protein